MQRQVLYIQARVYILVYVFEYLVPGFAAFLRFEVFLPDFVGSGRADHSVVHFDLRHIENVGFD